MGKLLLSCSCGVLDFSMTCKEVALNLMSLGTQALPLNKVSRV